ncbi:hypothetical protein IFR05_003567 [Cadophora sp. M221]|nr:hypothetical protein IFR05_003567 [Cadophora sp. M221]
MSNNPEDGHAFGNSISLNDRPLIWIDALCINQDDAVERGHQVDMMGDLYRAAFEVLSWLGTPDTEEVSDIHLDTKTGPPRTIPVPAFQVLNRSPNERGFSPTGSIDLTMRTLAVARDWKIINYFHQLVMNFKDAFEQLADVCHSAYWNRLWIIQEVCLAQRLPLVYGRQMLDWTVFRTIRVGILSLVKVYKFNPNDYGSGVSRMKESPAWRIANFIDGPVDNPKRIASAVTQIIEVEGFLSVPLERALEVSCDSLCDDKKDKVYGVLGLAEDVDVGDISVDYSQSLFALYFKTMVFYQTTIDRLNLFRMPRISARFSQILQKALLGPDVDPSAFEEMRHRALEELDIESLSTRFSLYGYVKGTVVAVLDACESVRRCCEFDLEMISESEKVMLDIMLEELDQILGTEKKWKCFITDVQGIGIGSGSIQAGDVVWRDYTVKGVQAIGRNEKAVLQFVSELRFSAELPLPRQTTVKNQWVQTIFEVSLGDFQVITCPKEIARR